MSVPPHALFILTKVEPTHRWFFKTTAAKNITTSYAPHAKPMWLAYNPHEPKAGHIHLDPAFAHRKQKAAPPQSTPGFLARWLAKPAPAAPVAVAENETPSHIDRLLEQVQVIHTLVTLAQAQNAQYVALVRETDLGVTAESITYAVQLAHARQADVLRCTQLDGLVPVVASVAFLERWLAADPAPDPAALRNTTPETAQTVLDLTLADNTTLYGQVRCYANDEREMCAREFFQTHASEIAAALQQSPEQPGAGRAQLEKIITAYREQFPFGLEAYRIVGTLSDVNELRKKMHTTPKPVVDYFVIATHYVRFLREYAGLQNASHVVDIGCSWGYLGFALANVLNAQGSYTGVEVQQPATEWARERLTWLGPNFRFEHLDIYNDFYNPRGETKRHQVMLPFAPDRSVDVFFAASVFTHMLSDGVQSYFQEFKRTLSPNGIAAFSIDDSMFFGEGQDEYIALPNTPDELTYYSRKRVNEMLAAAGLRAARPPVNLIQFDRTDYQTWHFATHA